MIVTVFTVFTKVLQTIIVVILASDGPLYAIAFLYHLERDDATSEQLVARVPRGHRQVDGCAHGFVPASGGLPPAACAAGSRLLRASRHFICAACARHTPYIHNAAPILGLGYKLGDGRQGPQTGRHQAWAVALVLGTQGTLNAEPQTLNPNLNHQT